MGSPLGLNPVFAFGFAGLEVMNEITAPMYEPYSVGEYGARVLSVAEWIVSFPI
jgi:hypothetical protein